MFELPPLPSSLDAVHPLIVHFPVALLLVAPLLVVLGVVAGRRGRGILVAALVVMALGAAASWLAVASGEAAAELAERGAGVGAVLEQHEERAETVRTAFTLLTVVFGALLLTPRLLPREPSRTTIAIGAVVFLAAYGLGALHLARTAHDGGRLVHELGVRALIAPSPATPALIGHEDD